MVMSLFQSTMPRADSASRRTSLLSEAQTATSWGPVNRQHSTCPSTDGSESGQPVGLSGSWGPHYSSVGQVLLRLVPMKQNQHLSLQSILAGTDRTGEKQNLNTRRRKGGRVSFWPWLAFRKLDTKQQKHCRKREEFALKGKTFALRDTVNNV